MKSVRHKRSAREFCVILIFFFGAAESQAVADGNVSAGRQKIQKCEVCHGLDGQAKIVEAPNLAGQNEAYMIRQLNAFKSGERQNELMSIVAPTLSPEDIEDFSAYYAAIPVTIGKLPGE
jgi:cytochrome c553